MKLNRFAGLEALEDTKETVLVSEKTFELYTPKLRNTHEAPELLEQFLWNRLPAANQHKRRLIFGYARPISPVTANFNPPLTAINWVNTAPNIWSNTDKLPEIHIAQRAIYGNERATDTRLRPLYAGALLLGRQYLAYKGGGVSGEALPLYGIDTIVGGLAARAAYCWTIDVGAHNARGATKSQEAIDHFLRIFEFQGAKVDETYTTPSHSNIEHVY